MKKLIFLTFLLLSYVGIYSQVHTPFKIRQNENLKGGLKMIGNQILNKHPANENHNDDTGMNDLLPMKYVDIDNDENTFSSSAATLTFDNPTCSKIKYAGLYWGGVYLQNDPNLRNIKIKIPSQTDYIDIEADTFIYDGYALNIQQGRDSYICYKDITELLSNANPTGEYVVANVKASRTTNPHEVRGGVSAGWSLVIIYEDPDKSNKNITTFDGYARITKGEKVDFSFSGFKTLPSPLPVNARFGVMALEGDKDISGDKLSILKPDGSYEDLSNSINPANNFFNSSISEGENLIIDRHPASTNTLGWDIDLFSIPNTNNSIIQNDQETASFKAHSTGDLYNIFFSAFEVEVIEPKMNLLKTAQDVAGNILNNQTVALGSTVYYGLEFQNVGNDDVVDYQIKDFLPKNVTLDTSIPFEIPAGSGITHSVNNSTNGSEITFKIPNELVKKGGEKHKIRFAVKLSSNCSDFEAPCSEKIINKAKSTYKGTLNQSIINDNGSFSSIDNCNIGILEDTVFYADLTPCVIPENIELLCGENLVLTAQAGFDKYEWKDNMGNIISTNQTVIISASGRYTLIKHTNNCVDRQEIYNVSTVQRQGTNPLIPYSEVTFTCAETHRTFPQIFLCGTGASKSIDLTSIQNVATVNLEKYAGTQSLALEENCPPNDNMWQSISSSKTFSLTEEGIYKLNLTFQNGCLATYYFRVHTSPINPTISKEDIYCKNGKISVQNASSDYEYAIELQGTTESPVYQQSPDFEIETAGIYSVLVRKKVRL
ncbi:isopeptide-forming domain-containing fimbrial protein, partial [Capnocytophaga felis]|uniref:isopeptide-forming domain-containing fimbrial protein n=1 Tax=Capnocytophaga felis TaxID=2267611 RepID=UPI0012D31B09